MLSRTTFLQLLKRIRYASIFIPKVYVWYHPSSILYRLQPKEPKVKSVLSLFTVAALLALTGCSKKEVKTNWNNVKEGTKNTWKKTKHAFSEETKEFKESTK